MNVPKLRFHEFTNEWVKHSLSDFTERVTRKNKNEETDIPLTISSLDGLVDQREYFNKTVASKDMSGYFLLKKGEFAYNKSYSVGYDYGSIKRLDKYAQGALSTLYICFSLTDRSTVDSDFIVQYFDSLKWNSEAALICAEGARNHGLLNVSPNDFFKMAVTVPASLKEQNKITECLSTLDHVINQTQSEIDAWEKQKRGVMQMLFSRKVRFKADDGSEFPEWEEKKLGECSDLITKGTTPHVYSSKETDVNFIKIESIENGKINESKCAKIDNETHQAFLKRSILCEDDILFAIAGSLGLSCIIDKDILPANTNQALAIIRLKSDSCHAYVYYVLNSCVMQNYIKQCCTVGAQPNLSLKQMCDFIFPYPCIEEQQKIAACLSGFDDVIDKAKKELEAYRELKKGLLQQMFV